MRLGDLLAGLRDGTVTLDFCGHWITTENRIKEDLLERYDDTVALANGSNDGKWSVSDGETVEESDASMRDFYTRLLNREIEEGVRTNIFPSAESENCQCCGRRLMWILEDKVLYLRGEYYKVDGDRREWVDQPSGHMCSSPDREEAEIIRGEISVNSNLLISNFFNSVEDTPEGKKYDQEYNLCLLYGVKNISRYKQEHNIAYGQMGNMSIGVFLHPSKKSIILGNPWIADRRMESEDYDYDEETYDEDYKNLSVIDGHHLVGEVCLDVWRWEATDLDTAKEEYQEIKDSHRDLVELEVPHGTWEFVHYGHGDYSREMYVTLTLKE